MVDLTKYDDEFARTKAAEAKEFDEVPDGRYVVEVAAVGVMESRAGEPMVKWALRIVEGELARRMIWKYSMIKEGKPMEWLKADLKLLGFGTILISEIPGKADAMKGIKISVHKKTVDGFAQIYFGSRQDAAPF